MAATRGAERGARALSDARERAEPARRESEQAARARADSLAEASSMLGIVAHELATR